MTRWASAIALWLVAATGGGCSLPVSIPLASLAGLTGSQTDETITTGSTGPRIEEDGLSERLGAADWGAVRAAIARAVEQGEDGESFSWRARSGGGGTVVPISAYFGEAGNVCRRLAITASRPELVDVVLAEACQEEASQWRVRPAAEPT